MTERLSTKYLLVGMLSVLFFTASAYGVQRTILATGAERKVPVTSWFTGFNWIYIAFTLAGFGLFKSIAGFMTGVSTKRFGTRNVILAGCTSFIVGGVPLIFSGGNPSLLAIGNSFLGAGEGLLYAAAMTYLSDITPLTKRAQVMGIMESAVYGGYTVGAILAGLLSTLMGNPDASFLFSFVVTIIALMLALGSIKKTQVSETESQISHLRTEIEIPKAIPVTDLLIRPTVFVTFIVGHISKMADSIIVLFLPIVLNNAVYGYGLSIEETGLITGAFTLAWALSMPLSGLLSDWIGRKRPILFGLLLEATALVALQWGIAPFVVLLGFALLGGLGVGLYYPLLPSIAVDVAPEDEKARLIGWYRSVKDLGYFTGPFIAGMIAQTWFDTGASLKLVLALPLVVAAFLLVLGSLIVLLARETRPGWAQFRTVLVHAQTVESSVKQATRGLLAYLEQNEYEDRTELEKRLSNHSLVAKKLEVEADRQLEEIAVQTFQRFHKSPDAGTFVRISRRLDRVAGLTLGALYRLQVIPIEDIPSLIQEKLHDAAYALRSLVETAVDGLQVLELKLDAVPVIYRTIRERETELDLLYRVMNRQLYISAHEMHYGTWYAIRDVVNMIEEAADSAEDAAEVMNFLAIKYKT
ncbi:MAG: MFS transporter [Candidatus Heimdallarchaeota archaeon]